MGVYLFTGRTELWPSGQRGPECMADWCDQYLAEIKRAGAEDPYEYLVCKPDSVTFRVAPYVLRDTNMFEHWQRCGSPSWREWGWYSMHNRDYLFIGAALPTEPEFALAIRSLIARHLEETLRVYGLSSDYIDRKGEWAILYYPPEILLAGAEAMCTWSQRVSWPWMIAAVYSEDVL